MGSPFGAGDGITLSRLAWDTWKSYKDAPQSFQNISQEVLTMHAVIRDAEELLGGTELTPSRQDSIRTAKDGCDCLLKDLQKYLKKYESLGTNSKRSWERFKWGEDDIQRYRMRLISNTTMLASCIRSASASFVSIKCSY
jgi:hypothetical protein